MKPARFLLFCLIPFFSFLTSCVGDPDILVSEFVDFGENGMVKNHQYELSCDSTVLAGVKGERPETELMVRYSSHCRIKYLVLNMEILSLNEYEGQQQLKIPLFDDKGKPLGKGGTGLYLLSYPLNIGYEEKDSCSFFFSTPLDDTKGVESLGIVIKKRNKP